MTKRLMKVGNSLALVIDKPILALFGISEETELEITPEGNGLRIVPVAGGARKAAVRAASKRVMAAHAKTFAKLAK